MIVVSTNGDPVATVLDGYAKVLVQWTAGNGLSGTVTHLGPPISTAQRIQHELQNHQRRSFYFFGHGSSAGFQANDGRSAVDQSTANLLAGRAVSANCCHGDQIGQLAPTHAFSLLGYTGTLWVPIKAPYISEMEGPALEGPKALAQGIPASQGVPIVRRAYSTFVRILHKGTRPGDKTFALFASINASRINAW
jgi:hypothetical protein